MANLSELRCDICGYRDGHQGFDLIRCEDCGVAVHKECNGMSTYRKRTFRCLACESVGQSFQVRKRLPNGERLRITQMERPTRCDLCSVRDGVHAMHPIFDGSGKTGRFLFQDGETPRLVWGHSLCAFYLSTQGLMHGCSRDGHYDGLEDDDAAEPDDGSVNPDLTEFSVEELMDYGDSAPIHHFVYYLKKPNMPHTDWTLAVEEHKSYYTCSICGKNDDKRKVLRIPCQCVAGSEAEFSRFRYKHHSLGPGEICKLAAHVGCAKWGGSNPNGVKRVYYFPGTEGDEVVACLYCTLHAEDLNEPLQARRKMQQKQRASQEAIEARRPMPMKGLPNHSTVLPSLAKVGIKKRPRVKAVAGPKTSAPSRLSATMPSRKRAHENLDKSIAVSVSQVARPTLATSRKFLANQKSVIQDNTLERLVKDLEGKIIGKVYDAGERSKIMKERKKFWKRELSELETNDFKGLWQEAKKRLKNSIIEDEERKREVEQEKQEGARIKQMTVDLTLDDDEEEPKKGMSNEQTLIPKKPQKSFVDPLGSALAATKQKQENRGDSDSSSDEENDGSEGASDRWAHLSFEKYQFEKWDSVRFRNDPHSIRTWIRASRKAPDSS